MIPRASAGRLSQIAQHLAGSNTTSYNNTPAQPRRLATASSTSNTANTANMSSQPDHPTLLIPGPIEFDDAVLQSMSHYR